MAKDKITDYSATNASNTDVGGVNIQGSSTISKLDDGLREVMTHLAEMNAGTYPLHDTLTLADPADTTKKFRFDGGSVTAGQTRVLTVPDADGTIMYTSAIGSTVQAYGALLTAIEALTTAAGKYLGFTGSDTVEMRDIIGTVSGTGGGASTDTTYTVKTPTGALVESGAGANGHYAKWADGTMICWLLDGSDKSSDDASGNIYGSTNNATWTFPAAFVIAPVVTGQADIASRWVSCAAPTTTAVDYKHWSATSQAGSVNTRLMAVGRWY